MICYSDEILFVHVIRISRASYKVANIKDMDIRISAFV